MKEFTYTIDSIATDPPSVTILATRRVTLPVLAVVRYGAVPTGKLIEQIEETGREVSEFSRKIIASFVPAPGAGTQALVALPLRKVFENHRPSGEQVYASAAARGLAPVDVVAVLTYVARFGNQPSPSWFRFGHEPYRDPEGNDPPWPIVLGAHNNPSKGGLRLRGDSSHPDGGHELDSIWVFALPAVPEALAHLAR